MSSNAPDLNQPQDFSDDPVPTNFGALPEARGVYTPMLQPGTYIFQLPNPIERKQFEQYATNNGPRLRMNLRDDKALKNITMGGQPFSTQFNNTEQSVGFGDDTAVGDDLAWLIAAVGGSLPDKAGNKSYYEELVKHGGKHFKADVKLTGRCNEKEDVYKDGEKKPGVKGCGQRFEIKAKVLKQGPNAGKTIMAIPRDPATGGFAEGVTCKCGAEVRVFANLVGIRSATE